jgi:hypothetical protein
MMTKNTERGIKIVGGIANTASSVGLSLTQEKLITLLDIFDQHPNQKDDRYALPKRLVGTAFKKYKDDGDSETAGRIKKVFPWFDPEVDLSLLD